MARAYHFPDNAVMSRPSLAAKMAPTPPAWSRRLARAGVLATAVAGSIGCAASRGGERRPATTTVALIAEADAAEANRDHARARELYRRAIASAPDPVSARAARRQYTETLLSWGELAAAQVQLAAQVQATPDDAASWHDLAMVYSALGETARAVEAFASSIAAAPLDARPRLALAALLWRTGRRPEATAEYRRLLDLDLTAALRSKVEWALAQLAPTR
jgi:tetratricopeptide (TPR) repeat protein